MRRPASFSLLLLLGAALPSRQAMAASDVRDVRDVLDARDLAAPREPPVVIALVAGALTAFIPLALGGARAATASSFGARDVGYVVAGVGPALSPIVSHAVLGEWARAAAFGAPTVAADVGLACLFQADPGAAFAGTIGTRSAFSVLLTVDLFGAGVSMVDVLMARERWEARRKGSASDPTHGLTIAPRVSAHQLGVVVGGSL